MMKAMVLCMRPFVVLGVAFFSVMALNGCTTSAKRTSAWVPPALGVERTEAVGPVCVSFSGGGLRSAAFSIGVMQGLHEAELLDDTTIISATSGGGYAASWLYIADRLRKIGAANALDPLGEEQARLEAKVEFFVPKWFGVFTLGTGAATEALFGTMRNASCSDETPTLWPSGGSIGYGNAIARVFFAQMDFASTLSDRRNQGTPIGLKQPIFGVSLVTGFRPSCDVDYLRSDLKAAEFSREGVRTIDGKTYPIGSVPFRDLVSSAGGAPDVAAAALRPAPAEGEAAPREVFNLCRIPAAVRPLIGHAFCARSEGEEEKIAFMTDGGFTDNLAVMPLLRRECSVIIASDASHDPALDFDSLRQVAGALTEAGINFEQIESQVRGVDRGSTHRFVADQAATAVGGHVQENGEAFWLVKLAVPKGVNLSALPASVADALGEARENTMGESGCSGEGISHRCRFPQQSTSVQHYKSKEFRAYRDLGRWIVREELVPKLVSSGLLRAVK